MFLNEVALGREHTITRDDGSLRKPPAGYDSVVARGQQEPGWISIKNRVINFALKLIFQLIHISSISTHSMYLFTFHVDDH